VRILTEPDASLTEQYTALLATEGADLKFTADGIQRIAELGWQVNETTENIGARRLHTILERLLEDISYNAPDLIEKAIVIDAAYVDKQLTEFVEDEDLSRYIL
jgi:ATP-dependent HslUV protease ATP-binding subunit HslU